MLTYMVCCCSQNSKALPTFTTVCAREGCIRKVWLKHLLRSFKSQRVIIVYFARIVCLVLQLCVVAQDNTYHNLEVHFLFIFVLCLNVILKHPTMSFATDRKSVV